MLRGTPNYYGCILRTACDEESQINAHVQIAVLKVQHEKEEFMQVDVAQEIDIDEMVALDALVSGNESRRNLITQIVKQHHDYVARQEIKIVGFLLMHEHFFELPSLSCS
jgi:hypothetical protein